ncbi:cGMP-dependent protein kinase, isozyme 1-like [Daphnia pulex]|uniref:cGMP-dependent protein kinase, isozyme 1-like n=1 Tax=Daphnia pulex TaxID=6669 RepID=UPI001EDD415D|nr:cGMP-dependent protein kinase, isozyme 1-like [Daphnia pulex]XP_046463611.1 cGMP-dependent protein kinase, isozyme 1-like [Daphnia pulex]
MESSGNNHDNDEEQGQQQRTAASRFTNVKSERLPEQRLPGGGHTDGLDIEQERSSTRSGGAAAALSSTSPDPAQSNNNSQHQTAVGVTCSSSSSSAVGPSSRVVDGAAGIGSSAAVAGGGGGGAKVAGGPVSLSQILRGSSGGGGGGGGGHSVVVVSHSNNSSCSSGGGGGGGGAAPSAPHAHGVGVGSQTPSERAASHPPALVPSHHHSSPLYQQQQQQHHGATNASNSKTTPIQHSSSGGGHHHNYQQQPTNFTSSIGGVRIMGHGASCLTGSAAPASSSSTNNCSVSSFTPLQRNQPTQQQHKGTAASVVPASSTTTTQPNTTTTTTAGSTGSTDKNNTINNSTTVRGGSSNSATAGAGNNKMTVPEDYHYLCNLVPELKTELKERESRLDLYQTETLELKRRLKKRDEEIGRLQREIHKLKSVLQATSRGQQDGSDLMSALQITNNGQQTTTGGITSGLQLQLPALFAKRQGVSGESSDLHNHHNHHNNHGGHHGGHQNRLLLAGAPNNQQPGDISLLVTSHDKDFRAKQLIKDAVMENDFLKNLDATQVREIVESMYPREFEKGSYVIREGDAGSHLYVSAEGELEVIQGDRVLGRMGPGKAFGELAILYNCTRTASIKAVTSAKVWALDRRVFQQVMKKTGLQRIDDNLKFLRSVPLFERLTTDHMSKIADVLEVEFYPAGTYIVRQGGRGDNFFIIASGRVQITQRLPGKLEEEEVRVLENGDYFGEQALLKEECRSANVIALPPGVECLTLGRDSFIQLIGDLSELRGKTYDDESRGFSSGSSSVSSRPGDSGIPVQLISEYAQVRLADLDVVATLGIGGFGRVELVQCAYDRSLTFALKCLKKQHIVNTLQQEHIYSEKNIMMSCRSPFIARLYNTYRDNKYVYMLMEACLGGELWTILRDRGHFDDGATLFYTACVIEAFDYLHSRNIIYRDLKPENLLLDSHGYVKLVDFGFSKLLGVTSKTWTFCGTPEYVAPEIILNKGHDRAVDYWSLGILIFELLTGTPPFTSPDPMKTYNIILKGIDQIEFPRIVNRAAQALIKRLCREVPAERLGYQRGGIDDIKKHRWFQVFDWDGLSNRTLAAPITPVVRGPADSSNFDTYPKEKESPPDELSGWDVDFQLCN